MSSDHTVHLEHNLRLVIEDIVKKNLVYLDSPDAIAHGKYEAAKSELVKKFADEGPISKMVNVLVCQEMTKEEKTAKLKNLMGEFGESVILEVEGNDQEETLFRSMWRQILDGTTHVLIDWYHSTAAHVTLLIIGNQIKHALLYGLGQLAHKLFPNVFPADAFLSSGI